MKNFIAEAMVVLIVAMIGATILNAIEIWFFDSHMPVKLEAMFLLLTVLITHIVWDRFKNNV